MIVCWVQQACGCSGTDKISGRDRPGVIDAWRSGQRIFPAAAGQVPAVAAGVVAGVDAGLVAG